jgi:hypothetical protein
MSKPFLATLLLVGAAGIALGPSACSLPGRADDAAQSIDGLAGMVGDAGPRGNVVIAAVYAGGGTASSTFKRDFVVLFNRTKSDITLTDGTLQYAAPLDEFGATADKIFQLGGTIKAGSYVLVALQPNQGGQGTNDVPVAAGDIAATTSGGFDLDPTGGKLALVIGSDKAGCGTSVARCTSVASVVDYVGWGTVADYEGAGSVAALSATKAAVRKGNGCTDANSNGADFEVVDPITKNSATTPAVDCTPVGPPRDSGGPVPPVLDPELGDEPPLPDSKRRDAGSGSGASGASSSSCAATTNSVPAPFALLAVAASAALFASRRPRR